MFDRPLCGMMRTFTGAVFAARRISRRARKHSLRSDLGRWPRRGAEEDSFGQSGSQKGSQLIITDVDRFSQRQLQRALSVVEVRMTGDEAPV